MSIITEPTGRRWRIQPSIIAAFVCGMLVIYPISAGPMAHVLRSRTELYAKLYDPLCVVTNRLPSPVIDWYLSYVQSFEPIEYHQGCGISPGVYAPRTGHIESSNIVFLVHTRISTSHSPSTTDTDSVSPTDEETP